MQHKNWRYTGNKFSDAVLDLLKENGRVGGCKKRRFQGHVVVEETCVLCSRMPTHQRIAAKVIMRLPPKQD